MLSPRKIFVSLALIAFMGLAGYFLAQLSMPKAKAPQASQAAPKPAPVVEKKWGKLGSENSRKPSFKQDDAALTAGALPGQRSLKFSSREALEDFIKRAGDSIRVMDRIDSINALRVGFIDPDALANLLDGTEQEGFIFPAYTPNPSGGVAQSNAVPLGNKLLDWLGLDSMDTSLGKGILIAILDTGVVAHPGYGEVKNYLLKSAPDNQADWNGHGTAAASLIIGNSLTVPGAAPGATLTSWRVADDTGSSDSWTIAQAIIQAVDAGNQIISLSMGSYGDSIVLYDAVTYAQSKGTIIVASAGNDGYLQSSYPASYPGVIAATAVDAENNHLLFSNLATSNNGLSAPGWEAAAAYPGDKVTSFSGTSAAAPIIAGTIASVMSAYNVSATQAYNIVLQYTNETGTLGYDSQTGAGAPNLGRIFQSTTPNVSDAAVASQVITAPATGQAASVQINIQNQGTTPLANIPVNVTTPNGPTSLIVANLAPNEVKSFNIPLAASYFANNASVSVSSSITMQDNQAANNQRTTTLVPTVIDP